MVTKATSITAADLSKLTQAAVKASAGSIQGKFVGKGPTMGYILLQKLPAASQLALATKISSQLAANAKEAGISGLRPKPVVVLQDGRITAGFWPAEIGIPVIRA